MKSIFSSMIAIILIAIYVYLVKYGVQIVICIEDVNCKSLSATDFNDRMSSTLTLISGLISALVIAELSVTQKGEAPAARLINKDFQVNTKKMFEYMTWLYLLVWLITGLIAFIYGYLIADSGPNSLTVLADLGFTWFGLAIGAGYAYFGIKPSEIKQ